MADTFIIGPEVLVAPQRFFRFFSAAWDSVAIEEKAIRNERGHKYFIEPTLDKRITEGHIRLTTSLFDNRSERG